MRNHIAEDGTIVAPASSVVLLEWLNGNLFQVNGPATAGARGVGGWTAVSLASLGFAKH